MKNLKERLRNNKILKRTSDKIKNNKIINRTREHIKKNKILNETKDRIRNNKIVKHSYEHRYFGAALILIIILITYSYLFKGFIYEVVNSDINGITDFINSFGNLSIFIFVALIILENVLAPIPGLILNVAGGIAFGPFLGAVLSIVGNMIGASLCYLIAKYFARKYVEKILDENKMKVFHKYNEKYGHFVLFILRLNPLTSSDIFSYLAGLTKMKYKNFIISTTLGIIPTMFVLSYFGDVFIKKSPVLILIFLILTVLYLLVLIYGVYMISRKKIQSKLSKIKKSKE
ncbi:MAG: TVP38/TMEM64 family protein [archaeon]